MILRECWQFPWPFAPLVPEAMPKVKRSRKPPPDGWELIEPTLDELDQKMREGEWCSQEWDPKTSSQELLHEYRWTFFVSVPPVVLQVDPGPCLSLILGLWSTKLWLQLV